MWYKVLAELNEKGLFQLMKKRYPDLIDLNFKDKYSNIDWFSPSQDLWIEGKCRSKHFQTLYIEEKKYQLLRERCGIYVSSTPEGIFAFYPCDNPELFFSDNKMRASTFYGGEDKVPKSTAHIRLNQCLNLEHLLLQ